MRIAGTANDIAISANGSVFAVGTDRDARAPSEKTKHGQTYATRRDQIADKSARSR